ncbi:hypothetical protein MMC11_008012 [Xylographa trunciseda]|nr:hypothetical protein [Xylographa trunciseda]
MTQQGSVDWVALSNTTVSFSVEMLSRFAKAGVDVLTISMAQALFSQFNLPAEGQLRLQESLSKLKAFSSFGNLIWFGIGVKHIVRSLAETEQGACCTAICACLSVCYKTDFSARVLKEFCDSSNIPRSLTPALSQWATLVDVCAGSVEASGFPHLVEGFSRLFSSPKQGHYAFQAVTSPQAFAAALVEIARLSRGNLRSITIRGGVDCACLAAIAEWLFALRIEIRDDLTGFFLYKSGKEGVEAPQVIFLILSGITPKQDQIITTTNRVCNVTPGKLELNANVKQLYFSNGRSSWSDILHNTFGTTFDNLMDQNCLVSFAQILCFALQPRIQINDSFSNLDPWGASTTVKGSEGLHILLHFATRQLPELTKLNDVPLYKLGYNTLDVGTPRSRLRDECGCRYCKLRYSDHETEASFENVSLLCLCRCAATICEFLWILSWLDLDDTITPSSTGLLMLYATQITRIDSKLEARYRSLGLLTSVGAHPADGLFDKLKFSLWDGFSLSSILQLFTGVPTGATSTSCDQSAICGNGICVYLPSLEDPSLGIMEQLRIRVVAGQISYNHAPAKVICDMGSPFDMDSRSVGPFQKGSTERRDISDILVQFAQSQLVFHMVIGETMDSLQLDLSYSISASIGCWYTDELAGYLPRRLQRLLVDKICKSDCTGEGIFTSEDETWSGKCSISTLDQWTNHYPDKPFEAPGNGWIIGLTLRNHQIYYCLKGTASLYYWILLANNYTPDHHPYKLLTFFVHTSTCCRCCAKPRNQDVHATLSERLPVWSGRERLTYVDCDGPEPKVYDLNSKESHLNRHDRSVRSFNLEAPEPDTTPFDNASQHLDNYRHLAGIGASEFLDRGPTVSETREPINMSFLTDRSRKLA